MRSASVSLSCATLVVLLLSLLVDDADASPLPNGAGASDGSDLLIHHMTRSRYCGRKLTETLAMLCQGRYPMMSHHRSG